MTDDIALAYTRVARAVRLAILLQSRLVDDARARTAAETALAGAGRAASPLAGEGDREAVERAFRRETG